MKAVALIIGSGRVEVEVGDLRNEQAAELVFCRLNHGSGQELEGYRGRSMSVDDCVEVPTEGEGTLMLRCAPTGWMHMIKVGSEVRIKRGICGEGHRFRVSKVLPGFFGEVQVYGDNYGPVRATEVEVIK